MKFTILVSVISALVALGAAQDNSTATSDDSLAAVRAAFYNAHIPQDLRMNFNPDMLLDVTFPQSHGGGITVNIGQQLPRATMAGQPMFSVKGNIRDTDMFVIAAVDPDVPTPQHPTEAQMRDFLGANFVRGADLGNGFRTLMNRVAPITDWQQPNPPRGSDLHRIVFLLFEQSRNFNQQMLVTPNTPRDHFDMSTFAMATGLGDPRGGMFVRVGPGASS